MGLRKTNVSIFLFRRGRCICWPFHYTPGWKNTIRI